MFRIKRRWVVAVFLVAGLLSVGPILAESSDSGEPAAGPAENVLLTVRMGKIEENKRVDVKSYDLVVVSGGLGSRLLSGARVPFPTSGEDDGDTGKWVYQNIGFTTEVHVWVTDDGRIKLIATLEDSRVESGKDGMPPSVETRQLSINAMLTPGKALVVGRVEGIRDRSGFVEVEAKILR